MHKVQKTVPSYILVRYKEAISSFVLEQYVKGFQRFYAGEDVWPVNPCSFYLFYKQFSSLVERGKLFTKEKLGEKYSQHPLGRVTIKRTNQIDLRVCKNIKQSAPDGQILTLSSA